MNRNTDTNLETKDNTPYQSDEDLEELDEDLDEGLDEDLEESLRLDEDLDIDYESEAMSDDDDAEMIYHVDPKGVVRHNLELIGKVKQAFIFCRQCEQWKPLTADNSVTLPYGTTMRLQYKRYIGGICLTQKCNYEQWQKDLAKDLTKDLTKDLATQNK
jgi:hypothetical protein